MSAEPNLDDALTELAETANRIANDRNAYFKILRKALTVLDDVRCHVEHAAAQETAPGNTWAARDLAAMDEVFALAKEAGL